MHDDTLSLPRPGDGSGCSVELALSRRRSARSYAADALTSGELSQLLWAAQGMTDGEGRRAAPSAGALYPLSLYAVVGAVQGLAAGVYRYLPEGHRLRQVREGDARPALAQAALAQMWMAEAALALVFAADFARATGKYGDRGYRYVFIEAGHAAQNVMLQAQALGLGSAVVGAFHEEAVQALLELPPREQAIYLMTAGRQR